MNNIEFSQQHEKEIYEKIYANEVEGQDFDGYGKANHGGGHISEILRLNPKSIMDIGCGYGQFIIIFSQKGIKSYGVDIASSRSPKNNEVIWIKAPMQNIPVPDKSIDWVTSFDVLEHIPECDIDAAMEECKRIAISGCIHLLSCMDESLHRKVNGQSLHICIKPPEWWRKKMKLIGEIEEERIWKNQSRCIWFIRIVK